MSMSPQVMLCEKIWKNQYLGRSAFFDRKPGLKILPFDSESNAAPSSTRMEANSDIEANLDKKHSNLVQTLLRWKR